MPKSWLLLSHSVGSDSAIPWIAAHQDSLSFTVSWSLLKLMSIESVMPFKHLIPCVPYSSCLPSFPASKGFPVSWLLASGGQSTTASASVLPVNIQSRFPYDWLVGSPFSPTYSQESSPRPQFKSISSSMFSFLYGSILTSTHDCWKNHNFDLDGSFLAK